MFGIKVLQDEQQRKSGVSVVFSPQYKTMTRLWMILIIAIYIPNVKCNIKWLALQKYSNNEIWAVNQVCTKDYGFTGKQVRFCKTHFPWMTFVQEAVIDAKEECIHHLHKQKWDCHVIKEAPTFNEDLKKDTIQSALVYALSAASLAITVSRRCKMGQIPDCSCQHNRRVSFPSSIVNSTDLSNIDKIIPCKGIVQNGKRFTQTFTNLGFRLIPKNERQAEEIAVRKHNIQIGLKALGTGEEVTCVCTGATGGCPRKFCYRRIIPLNEAAVGIFERYKKAVKLFPHDFNRPPKASLNKGEMLKLPYQIKDEHVDKLVYLEDTDQQCATTGRRCVLDNSKPDSCENLCCGRGYRGKLIEVNSQCRCKFVYCCKVVCDNCISMKQVFECL